MIHSRYFYALLWIILLCEVLSANGNEPPRLTYGPTYDEWSISTNLLSPFVNSSKSFVGFGGEYQISHQIGFQARVGLPIRMLSFTKLGAVSNKDFMLELGSRYYFGWKSNRKNTFVGMTLNFRRQLYTRQADWLNLQDEVMFYDYAVTKQRITICAVEFGRQFKLFRTPLRLEPSILVGSRNRNIRHSQIQGLAENQPTDFSINLQEAFAPSYRSSRKEGDNLSGYFAIRLRLIYTVQQVHR